MHERRGERNHQPEPADEPHARHQGVRKLDLAFTNCGIKDWAPNVERDVLVDYRFLSFGSK
jgi:hypothetical protein